MNNTEMNNTENIAGAGKIKEQTELSAYRDFIDHLSDMPEEFAIDNPVVFLEVLEHARTLREFYNE